MKGHLGETGNRTGLVLTDKEAAACPGIENDGTCHGSDVCVAKFVWKRINDSITNAVDTLMLGQLIDESRRVHEEKMESLNTKETVSDILK